MSPKREANWYDKIFKENLEALSITLAQRVLGIEVVSSETLPTELARTIERKPDQVLRITDAAGETFVLHLEFQLADEAQMAERMLEYWLLLRRKYQLSVRQCVFYLGSKPAQMPTRLIADQVQFAFPLIAMNSVDYRLFADSPKAETVVFALLGYFGALTPQEATEQIVARLSATASDQLELERCLQQLRVLANLRQLQPLLDKIMESITKYFDPTIDPWYKQGELKGLEQAAFNMLAEGLTLEFVAKMTDLSAEQLNELQKKVKKG